MKAALIDGYGPPEVFRMAEVPVPEPGPGEVLVRVAAAGVNAIDWFTRTGQGILVGRFPAVLGWDVCGTVTATGAGTEGLAVGDRVFGMPRFPALAGAYAQYVAAPADQFARLPDEVDDYVAAGMPLVALTAWQSLFTHGELAPGHRVLVHGAAGGVGHVAVQMAKSAGAEVFCTASPASHEFVTAIGADRVADYESVHDVARDMDLVVDPRGGADFVRLLDVLRPGGMIVTLKGESPGHRELVRSKGLRAGFTYVGPDGATLAEVAAMMAAGTLTVEIQRVLGLDEVAVAHEIGEAGHVRGRLVLDVSSSVT